MSLAVENNEEREFREFCRAWLNENRPPPPAEMLPQTAWEVMTEDHRTYLVDWQSKCYEAGLIATDVEKKYGGHGYTGFQAIASSEVERAKVPYFINWIGLGMAAPTLLQHGTEEQKTLHLSKIFSGEDIWCQGFSEPGAGSDLAQLQTSAVKDSDSWVINGSKIWTSLAHFSSWMLLLARSDKNEKYGGLTYFIVPMEADGVTVQPIVKMTGEYGFNEVFFEDLRIPDHMRIDEVGAGWKVAMSTLSSERGAGLNVGAITSDTPASLMEDVEKLISLAKVSKSNSRSVWENPIIRDKIVKLYERAEAADKNLDRGKIAALSNGAERIPLQYKLTLSEIALELHQVALSVLGPASSLYVGDENAADKGRWPLGYMNSYALTISGGSSEIQRNILGERVLGLPKTK